ncbi:MAG: SDR family NAD(P)-dependent oxidoreductase [Schleiferiaceae bacterium]
MINFRKFKNEQYIVDMEKLKKAYQNKVIWITGASSGIGEALAKEWSQYGVFLILSGRNQAALEDVATSCEQRGAKARILAFDLSDIEGYPSIVHEALAWKGHIDFLVNNGGISQRGLATETDFSVDEKIVRVDLLSPIALSKQVLPHMLERNSGHIITTSSLVGKFGTPYRSAYSAAKHGLHGFFDSVRAELIQSNLHFTVLCPGFVQTQVSVNGLNAQGEATGVMDSATKNGITAEHFAQKALKAIASKKREAYIGGREVWGVYLSRYLPGLFAKVVARAKVK